MSGGGTSEGFYDEVEGFSDFADFENPRNFVRVPADWWVVITDVVSSTRAIEEGRYKDVNTIGAASISVVQERLRRETPYVFGGDGASLLLPAGSVDEAGRALAGLQRLAREKFDMELRVGRIAVSELYEAGATIEVGRYEMVSGKSIAVFRGGGLSEAESRIKGDIGRYGSQGEAAEAAELKGLSCRWNAIPSKRGCVMSLLVLSRDPNSPKAYERVLERLNAIFAGGLDDASPVHPEVMDFKGFKAIVADECRYHSSVWSIRFLMRFVEIVMTVGIFRHGLPPIFFNRAAYRRSMRIHSDFRKFDDMLRMIIDCTPQEAEALRDFLEGERGEGRIFYGVHISDSALMTCYVQNMEEGGHVHFIDGGDGGYAVAAKQLKGQLREREEGGAAAG